MKEGEDFPRMHGDISHWYTDNSMLSERHTKHAKKKSCFVILSHMDRGNLHNTSHTGNAPWMCQISCGKTLTIKVIMHVSRHFLIFCSCVLSFYLSVLNNFVVLQMRTTLCAEIDVGG